MQYILNIFTYILPLTPLKFTSPLFQPPTPCPVFKEGTKNLSVPVFTDHIFVGVALTGAWLTPWCYTPKEN